MQVTVESTSTIGRRMTVQVPAERIDGEVEKRLQSMRSRVRIDGFRPGKVPLRVVKQRYQQQVAQEVIGEVLQSSYQEAVTDQNLQPAGGPEIQPGNMGIGEGLEYIATFDIFPEFEVAPVASLEIRRPVAEVTEDDIDTMIERLRDQQKTWQVVDRPAQAGDSVTLDQDVAVNGETYEDSQRDREVEVGRVGFPEGLDEQLHGASTGDHVTVSRTISDADDEALAGETAVYDINVKAVSEGVQPQVDEAFIQGLGIAPADVDSLRAELRANMERELAQRINSRIKEQVMQGLRELNPIELPAALVKQEVDAIRKKTLEDIGAQIDESKLPDELFDEQARRRVATGLVMGEIVKQNAIEPDEQKIQQALENLASSYDDPQQVINYYRGNKEAMGNLSSMVIEDQVVEWVMDQAQVTDEAMSFDELVNPAPQENATNE